MTKADLVTKIAGDAGITKAQAGTVLDSLAGTITAILKQGEKFTLPGVGNFSISDRAAREGRNPKTGEKMQIAASKNVKFKALSAVKAALNG